MGIDLTKIDFRDPRKMAGTPKITMARILDNEKIEREARNALFNDSLYMPIQMALIETPMGYIVTDHLGGHKKWCFEKDETIQLLMWNRTTEMPDASCPAKIGELLVHYTDREMPIAEFIQNDSEKGWIQLIVTMTMGGINTKADEDLRKRLNKRMILGGTNPFDRSKL